MKLIEFIILETGVWRDWPGPDVGDEDGSETVLEQLAGNRAEILSIYFFAREGEIETKN